MFARVSIIGNLGRTPEFKDATNGRFAKFSVATNSWNGKEKVTTWWDVVCWDQKKVEFLEKYVTAGGKLFVEGELVKRTYTDKNGAEKLAVEISIGKFGGTLLSLSSAGHTTESTKDPIGDDAPF
jgi:single-strand DNA-binding protein